MIMDYVVLWYYAVGCVLTHFYVVEIWREADPTITLTAAVEFSKTYSSHAGALRYPKFMSNKLSN